MYKTILVVNPCEEIQKTLEDDLRTEYRVLEACGKDAMPLIRRQLKTLSAIVMHMTTNNTGLIDVLCDKHNSPLLSRIPLIVCVGDGDEEIKMQAVSHGANCVISIPNQSKMLKYLVRNAISLGENPDTANTPGRDSLTNLLSKEAFMQKAQERILNSVPGQYVISCVNIDNFKMINDQYGTAIGDEVLRYVGSRIDNCAEKMKGISCRFSMDMFAVLYPLEYMGSKLQRECHKLMVTPPSIDTPIRVRIGRYIIDDKYAPVSAAYDMASLAQKTIKDSYDTNIAFYNESMRRKMYHEENINRSMRKALNDGDFELWFQPQYNHATNALIGVEALARWRKDDALVMPDEFIPIFEKNGFIYEMDKYLWRQACMLQRRWLDEGKQPVPISVNVSRRDMMHEDVIKVISSLLEEYKLSREMIRLEITESLLCASDSQIQKRVNELIDMGFMVEIDDFGSGSSSLNMLKDVPAQILKMDIGFMRASSDPKRSLCIVKLVVDMAKQLGMAVIAEGIETKEQADFQKSIGCNYIQGYYYARPMPCADYEDLLLSAAKELKLAV